MLTQYQGTNYLYTQNITILGTADNYNSIFDEYPTTNNCFSGCILSTSDTYTPVTSPGNSVVYDYSSNSILLSVNTSRVTFSND